jgi:hypothetical protein
MEVPTGFPASPAAIEHVVLKAKNGKVAQPVASTRNASTRRRPVSAAALSPPNKRSRDSTSAMSRSCRPAN